MTDLVKILLVDDEPKFLDEVLPMYGYEVHSVYNGKQAIEKLDLCPEFDLVLLDVTMPVMDGWETLKTIRNSGEKYRDIPVIMLTAVSEDQKMITGLKIGADDYIVKPFILPNLLARIEAVLRRSKRSDKSNVSFNVTNKQKISSKTLTEREKDVLLLVTQGLSNGEISNKLTLSLHTVKSHIYSIYHKLNVQNRIQAVLLAKETDLLKKEK